MIRRGLTTFALGLSFFAAPASATIIQNYSSVPVPFTAGPWMNVDSRWANHCGDGGCAPTWWIEGLLKDLSTQGRIDLLMSFIRANEGCMFSENGSCFGPYSVSNPIAARPWTSIWDGYLAGPDNTPAYGNIIFGGDGIRGVTNVSFYPRPVEANSLNGVFFVSSIRANVDTPAPVTLLGLGVLLLAFFTRRRA
jgi:MYXO-CTERM domain-containing protein